MQSRSEILSKPVLGAVPHAFQRDRVHVLFLIDELCRKGGAEKALLNTVLWLPPERFRCSIITLRMDPLLPMLAEFTCPVQLLPLTCVYDWNAVKRGTQLAAFIRREKVDIVHTFFPSSDLWGGAIAKFAGRSILVSSRRDMGFMRGAKHRIGYRALGQMFDKVLAVSERVRRFSIEQDGLDASKVGTLYNAVDVRKVGLTHKDEIRNRLGLSGASHVIVSVGNIRRLKGFDVLIRAAAIVCREFPEAVFVVAGGSDPAEAHCLHDLEKLSSEFGIADNVKFLGLVEDVVPLLDASDAFCLLSRSEGFSNALLEAMASGISCVATRVGGNSEALDDGYSGFLVENEDHEAAATKICELLRDKELARCMGGRAQSSVSARFTPEIVISQLVAIYEGLLANRKQPVGQA